MSPHAPARADAPQLRQGRYPSNAQIDATLEYVLRNPPAETKKLSKEGRMLVQDLHNIIRTAKSMVQRKNHDELFQNFLFETRGIDTVRPELGKSAADLACPRQT